MNLNKIIIEKYKLSNITQIVALSSVNTLYSAYSDVFRQSVVLKFYKYREECIHEAEFLKLYKNSFFVKLLDTNPELNLNLFEKIELGQDFAFGFPQNEEHAIQDVCTIVDFMRVKHIKPSSGFPIVSSYFSSLEEIYSTQYKLPIKKCKKIFAELLSTLKEQNQYLLHGDLHHENILKSQKHENGFVVIDPKGVIGECEFEITCFVLNPVSQLAHHPNAKSLIKNRIKEFSKQLHLDRTRLSKYCFVKAVLSACFAIEDNAEKIREEFNILSKICENLLIKENSNTEITIYEDVNDIIADFVKGILKIFPQKLVGIYLTGSLSYYDFSQESSDIDLAIVLNDSVSEAEAELLKKFHQKFEKTHEKWLKRLECSYISMDMLQNLEPPKQPRPYFNEGIFYATAPYGHEWLINQYLLYNHSIALTGPDFKTLIKPIHISDVQKASVCLLKEWKSKIEDSDYLQNAHNQSYAVLTMCRILYTVLNNKVGSKREAAEWVKNIFAPEWQNLIEEAEHWYHGTEMRSQEKTEDFIKFTMEKLFKLNI